MGILSFFRRRNARPVEPEGRSRAGSATPKQTADVSSTPAAQPKSGVSEQKATIDVVHPALLEAIVTEKSSLLASQGQYTFRVDTKASKQDVAGAVERQYRVHVTNVHVVNVRPKTRMRGRVMGHVPGYRKAIVMLKQGEHIDLMSEVR